MARLCMHSGQRSAELAVAEGKQPARSTLRGPGNMDAQRFNEQRLNQVLGEQCAAGKRFPQLAQGSFNQTPKLGSVRGIVEMDEGRQQTQQPICMQSAKLK